jgi:hypothetical protein
VEPEPDPERKMIPEAYQDKADILFESRGALNPKVLRRMNMPSPWRIVNINRLLYRSTLILYNKTYKFAPNAEELQSKVTFSLTVCSNRNFPIVFWLEKDDQDYGKVSIASNIVEIFAF